MMDGFQDDPAATAEVNLHGWHHTGDIGWLNEEGFLTLVDRKKDMIISGGFNVFSVEVENALLSHPAVAEAAVVGVAHEKWGEAVVAVVERKAHQEASAAELIQHCKARIGSVKAPKAIHFVDSLPRNNNGKIEKKVIRQRLAEGTTVF
jgi:acyl-CoA synthetase (AMP-forming)/AMP-acid ligase II